MGVKSKKGSAPVKKIDKIPRIEIVYILKINFFENLDLAILKILYFVKPLTER